jgi:hypothetical protein
LSCSPWYRLQEHAEHAAPHLCSTWASALPGVRVCFQGLASILQVNGVGQHLQLRLSLVRHCHEAARLLQLASDKCLISLLVPSLVCHTLMGWVTTSTSYLSLMLAGTGGDQMAAGDETCLPPPIPGSCAWAGAHSAHKDSRLRLHSCKGPISVGPHPRRSGQVNLPAGTWDSQDAMLRGAAG